MDPITQMVLFYFTITLLIILGKATWARMHDRYDHSFLEYVWCRLKWWLLGVTAICIIYAIGCNSPEIEMLIGAEAQKNMPPIVLMAVTMFSMVSGAFLATCIPVCALAALDDMNP